MQRAAFASLLDRLYKRKNLVSVRSARQANTGTDPLPCLQLVTSKLLQRVARGVHTASALRKKMVTLGYLE